MALRDRIIEALVRKPGLTDRELTNLLYSAAKHPSQVNQECNRLAQEGVIARRSELAGFRNYLRESKALFEPSGTLTATVAAPGKPVQRGFISEDDVKRAVKSWLEADRWTVDVKWGRQPGVDIEAKRGRELWRIEAKGSGSLPAMRVNFFVGMLGETLQRMDEPLARYSIALPDIPSYHGKWMKLPALAKTRTGISVLFVDASGKVRHLTE